MRLSAVKVVFRSVVSPFHQNALYVAQAFKPAKVHDHFTLSLFQEVLILIMAELTTIF